ncbi:hypothetical protein [Lishizhenia tianjinensis]|uniref:hypothetical protein n=1 Tax=Lishizhenia tianjinensis TaxID=477690 RepID=UPI0011141A7E|nr:hypothetical protein [Lishizhenia tianjinensis]
METILCSNCAHSLACIHEAEQNRIQRLNCELHESLDSGVNRTSTLQITTPTPRISDLCSLCDFQANCSLRGGNEFIFYCEEYQ